MKVFEKIVRPVMGSTSNKVTVVDCQPVADYIFMETCQEVFSYTDYPCAVSPWRMAWLEWQTTPYIITDKPDEHVPKEKFIKCGDYFKVMNDMLTAVGVMVTCFEPSPNHYRGRCTWVLIVDVFLEWQPNILTREVLFLKHDGKIQPITVDERDYAYSFLKLQIPALTGVENSSRPPPENCWRLTVPFVKEQYREACGSLVGGSIMPIVLMSLSFTHCKNVILESRLASRAMRRRIGDPKFTYVTMTIEPMRKIIENARTGEANGSLQKALHICRGHFKDYREKGLFGKHKDIYWWDMYIRGSIEQGRVEKQYRIDA